jgi:hypothetical protein
MRYTDLAAVLAPPPSVTGCRLPPESCPDAAPESAQPRGGVARVTFFIRQFAYVSLSWGLPDAGPQLALCRGWRPSARSRRLPDPPHTGHTPPSRGLAPEECWPGRSSAGPRADDRGRADGGPPDAPDHLGIDVTPISAGDIWRLPGLYLAAKGRGTACGRRRVGGLRLWSDTVEIYTVEVTVPPRHAFHQVRFLK